MLEPKMQEPMYLVATSSREAWMPGTRIGLESPALGSGKIGPGTAASAEYAGAEYVGTAHLVHLPQGMDAWREIWPGKVNARRREVQPWYSSWC